MVHQNVRVA